MNPVRWMRQLSWPKRLGVLVGSFLLFLVLLVGVGYAFTSVPSPNKIATAQATRILYAGENGKPGAEMGKIGKNRTIVPLSKISKEAQHAVLAAEDRDFYSEPGISPKGIARALFTNVKGGGVSQGGSTITQQYAKNAFLTQERTFTRKIKEVFIAMKMSQTVSKDTILADYLNTIYFGRGAYGIEAASQAYFGSHAHAGSLTASQAAVLASSIRSPAGYEPTKHLDRAKTRWAYVLDGMVKKGWLAQDDRDKQAYPTLASLRTNSFAGPLDGIKTQVIDELQKHGFPEDRITAGGLTVQTTIAKTAEDAATQAVQNYIKASTGKNPAVGALVSVEPGTGKVVAYYGNRNQGDFDYASDGTGVQPGSSMKPYVLAAALENGTALSTMLDGSSPQTICGTLIHNDSGDPPLGQTDLVKGLELSVNTVYYRLACETGAQKVADLAHAAGIPKKAPLADTVSHKPTAQIALGAGGYEIHPIDQAVGYATFAANGMTAQPYFVESVKDGADKIYTAKASTSRAFTPQVAADTTYAMQQVVSSGTGTRAQLNGRPAAGKTGTTGNKANAWFAGFTPQLSTAVWVGHQLGGGVGGVYGGTLPAEIFKQYMDQALKGKAVEQFPPRANVGSPATPSGQRSTATASPTATPSTSPTATPTLSPLPVATVSVPPVTPSPTATPPPTQSPQSTPSAQAVASPAASP